MSDDVAICRYCGRVPFEYCKVIMSSSEIHITRRCHWCKSQIGQWVSKKLLNGIDLDTLPILADYQLNNEPCAVCGALGTELHHWAPKELFPDDYESNDKIKALAISMTEERVHLGTFYKAEGPVYTDFNAEPEIMSREKLVLRLFERFK